MKTEISLFSPDDVLQLCRCVCFHGDFNKDLDSNTKRLDESRGGLQEIHLYFLQREFTPNWNVSLEKYRFILFSVMTSHRREHFPGSHSKEKSWTTCRDHSVLRRGSRDSFQRTILASSFSVFGENAWFFLSLWSRGEKIRPHWCRRTPSTEGLARPRQLAFHNFRSQPTNQINSATTFPASQDAGNPS